jgi:RNA polymerase-associated protein CTR9
VREATADFSDVWLNIAHILVDQRQYIRAIQMYENCAKKFYKHTNIDVLGYLIRALYKCNRLSECKQMLLKARHVSPEDTTFMYNMALVQQKLSKQSMTNDKSTSRTVQGAIFDLEAANRTFQWLNMSGEAERLRSDFKCDFKSESKQCNDLLIQGSWHLARAKKLDDQEREMKERQEKEIRLLREKQLEEERQREIEVEQQRLALAEKRAEYVKKTQNLTQNLHIEPEKLDKKSRKKVGKKDLDDIVSSASDTSEKPKEEYVKKSKKEKAKKKLKKRKASETDASENDEYREENEENISETEPDPITNQHSDDNDDENNDSVTDEKKSKISTEKKKVKKSRM